MFQMSELQGVTFRLLHRFLHLMGKPFAYAKQKPVAKGVESSQDLPVHAARKELLALYDRHPTLIIQGETGSGKTTRNRIFLNL